MIYIKNIYSQNIVLNRLKNSANSNPNPVFIVTAFKFNCTMWQGIFFQSKNSSFYFFKISSRKPLKLFLYCFFKYYSICFTHFFSFSNLLKNSFASVPFSFFLFRIVRRSLRSSFSCRYSFSAISRYFFFINNQGGCVHCFFFSNLKK